MLTDLDPSPSPASSPSRPAPPRRQRKWLVVGALTAGAGYSWLLSNIDVTRFVAVAVALPMVAAAIAAFRSWMHHDRVQAASPPDVRRRFGGLHHRAVLAWSVLAALLIAWELRELTGSPRVDYPTVTSMVGTVTSFRPFHALAFLAWLVRGSGLIGRGSGAPMAPGGAGRKKA